MVANQPLEWEPPDTDREARCFHFGAAEPDIGLVKALAIGLGFGHIVARIKFLMHATPMPEQGRARGRELSPPALLEWQ